jgi:hypothetical protein
MNEPFGGGVGIHVCCEKRLPPACGACNRAHKKSAIDTIKADTHINISWLAAGVKKANAV